MLIVLSGGPKTVVIYNNIFCSCRSQIILLFYAYLSFMPVCYGLN